MGPRGSTDAAVDRAAVELGLQPAAPGRYCLCRRPYPGPLYWSYRCRVCDGTIVGWWTRRKLRKAAKAAAREFYCSPCGRYEPCERCDW